MMNMDNVPWCEKKIRHASLQTRFATDTLRYRHASLQNPKQNHSLRPCFRLDTYFGGLR